MSRKRRSRRTWYPFKTRVVVGMTCLILVLMMIAAAFPPFVLVQLPVTILVGVLFMYHSIALRKHRPRYLAARIAALEMELNINQPLDQILGSGSLSRKVVLTSENGPELLYVKPQWGEALLRASGRPPKNIWEYRIAAGPPKGWDTIEWVGGKPPKSEAARLEPLYASMACPLCGWYGGLRPWGGISTERVFCERCHQIIPSSILRDVLERTTRKLFE